MSGPRSALLQFATALASPETRRAGARGLAAAFGATDLLIFQRDPEIGVMLAAPGFPQAVPDGRRWNEFLDACIAAGSASATLRASADSQAVNVLGRAFGSDLVLVLVDVAVAPPPDVEWLLTLMPMFAAVFRGEREAAAAAAREKASRETATRSTRLTEALDRSRRQLEMALSEARSVRQELEAKQVELEARNRRLRDQARRLEQQAAELQAQSEMLRVANAELKLARAAADAASRAKTDFLATMSHELRTPLNAIGGHVQLIELGVHGPVTEEQRRALERIDRSQRHLLGLINNILNLSKIEAGRVEYRITDVSLDDALLDLAPMIEPQLSAKSINYRLDMPPGLPLVRADREKLQQVLLNLISNAIKFTEPEGTISVAGSIGSDDLVHLRVTDTGIGIAADKLESIFEPFTQVDSSHSRKIQGTGLGLAISRDLARGMGGELRARSTPGQGSSFTVTLRASPSPATTGPAKDRVVLSG